MPSAGSSFSIACGIDATVLYTSAGLASGLIHDADWAMIMARAYNDWLHQYFLRVNPRFQRRGAVGDARAARSRQRIRTLRARFRHGRRHAGGGDESHARLRTAAVRSDLCHGRTLDVPLGVHAGSAAELGLDHFTSFAGVYPLSHPFAQMQQLTSMMIHGVFERFPRCAWYFSNRAAAGCLISWTAWKRVSSTASIAGRINRRARPSEIMRGGNLYYSCEIGESTLELGGVAHGQHAVDLAVGLSSMKNPGINSPATSTRSSAARIYPKRQRGRSFRKTRVGCMV